MLGNLNNKTVYVLLYKMVAVFTPATAKDWSGGWMEGAEQVGVRVSVTRVTSPWTKPHWNPHLLCKFPPNRHEKQSSVPTVSTPDNR